MMKNIYSFILAFVFVLFHHIGFAQCSVSISASHDSTQLDCRTTTITLSANVMTSESVTYSWSRIAGGTDQTVGATQSITVTDSGLYKIIIKGALGCNASSSIRITKNTTVPTVRILAIPGAVCSGSSSSLIAAGAETYQWIQGSSSNKDTIVVSPAITTLYEVKGTTANGCSNTSLYNLMVNPLPGALISPKNIVICAGGALPKDTFTGKGGKAPYTFYFSVTGNSAPYTQVVQSTGNDSLATIDIPTSQKDTFTYTLLSVTDGNGCIQKEIPNQSAMVSIVDKPTLTNKIKIFDNFCSGSTFSFTAESKADTYSWTSVAQKGITQSKKNGTGKTITDMLTNTLPSTVPKVTYTFSLAIGGTGGCTNTDNVTVNVYPIPMLTSPATDKICSGYPYLYTPKGTTTQGSYNWSRPVTTGISGGGKSGFGIGIGTPLRDTLTNTTIDAVDVKYKYTLSYNNCSKGDTTVTVKVYPTPHLTSDKARSICGDSLFSYTATYPAIQGTTINWTSTYVKGIRGNTSGGTEATINNILINDSSVALTVVYLFTLTAPGNGCTKTDTVKVTVYPTPKLDDIKARDICSDAVFSYHPASTVTAANSSIAWISEADEGVSGNTKQGNNSIDIRDILVNNSFAPLKVNYIFTLTGGNNCTNKDTVTVTVHPTPGLSNNKLTACSNSPFTFSPQSSTTEPTSFRWARDSITNPVKNGSGDITDILVNTTLLPVEVKYIYTLTAGNFCSRNDTLTVTVYPALQKPDFTSFNATASQTKLLLCDSSENINFNVISPQPAASGVVYNWMPALDSPKVIIKNKNYPNTVISFNESGEKTITVTASYPNTTCTSSASQVVVVSDKSFAIKRQKIFEKQPGNLLIYPDNSLSTYQWGYDKVVSENPLATDTPVALQNQVYQFCIPDSTRFIKDDTLNTTDFYYWVLLHNNISGCGTKVYYNGPFDDLPEAVLPNVPGSNIQLQVIPNPNRGAFEVTLKGNMYGSIEAQVYNSAGQLVFRKKFVKTVADMTEKFVTNGLPSGVYFLLIRSSDLKQVRSRFIINP